MKNSIKNKDLDNNLDRIQNKTDDSYNNKDSGNDIQRVILNALEKSNFDFDELVIKYAESYISLSNQEKFDAELHKDKDDSIVKILSSAFYFFKSFGYKKTSLRDIAERCGMVKSNIYYYFKDKDHLYKTIIGIEAYKVFIMINSGLNNYKTAEDGLKRYLKARVEEFKRIGNEYHDFTSEYVEKNSFIEEIRYGYDKFEINLLKNFIVEGIENREFQDFGDDIDIVVNTIFYAVKGFEKYNALQDSYFTKNIDKMIEILFHGISS